EGFEDLETREDALRRIRAQAFNARWGQDASHRVRAEGDRQIQRALELFDRAERLLAQRKATGPEKVAEHQEANRENS
ncbi:MAG: hypothetical protein PVG07_15185, partial [Acidobacteriota bacterium]